jgi:hypothetical protein
MHVNFILSSHSLSSRSTLSKILYAFPVLPMLATRLCLPQFEVKQCFRMLSAAVVGLTRVSSQCKVPGTKSLTSNAKFDNGIDCAPDARIVTQKGISVARAAVTAPPGEGAERCYWSDWPLRWCVFPWAGQMSRFLRNPKVHSRIQRSRHWPLPWVTHYSAVVGLPTRIGPQKRLYHISRQMNQSTPACHIYLRFISKLSFVHVQLFQAICSLQVSK